MTDIACELEYSVEVAVSLAFVWDWRTDVRTWDDPPAQFRLDGPFAAGSWGTSRTKWHAGCRVGGHGGTPMSGLESPDWGDMLAPDGSLLYQHNLGHDVDSTAAITADGAVIVGTDDGGIYALEAAR